jgi:hypothetical protein
MKKRRIVFMLSMLCFPLVLAAAENPGRRRSLPTDLVDKPENREHARLRQGLRKGKLTREEARRLRQNKPAGRREKRQPLRPAENKETPPKASPVPAK